LKTDCSLSSPKHWYIQCTSTQQIVCISYLELGVQTVPPPLLQF
jgi:hypothetical protein